MKACLCCCTAHPAKRRFVLVRRRGLCSVAEGREEALLSVFDEGERYPTAQGLRVSIRTVPGLVLG